jgi:DNA-binding MarR family transcriptional regulator
MTIGENKNTANCRCNSQACATSPRARELHVKLTSIETKKPASPERQLLEIFTGMAQVTRCCRQDVAFCEGVTFHQFMILDAVSGKEELNMADLHTHLAVEKSTTTRLVNPLIKKGLLIRQKARHDSRAITLTLTDAGKKTHQKVSLCLAGFFQKVTKNIPEDKKDQVLESIRVFIRAIKASAPDYSCCK